MRFSLFHRKAKLPSTVSGTRRRTKTVRHSHSHREIEKAAAATRILSPKPALVASFLRYLRGARVCGSIREKFGLIWWRDAVFQWC